MWTEEEFLSRTEGSPLRRAGYERWLRNLAVGLGNAPSTIPVLQALNARREHPSELVREHVAVSYTHLGRPHQEDCRRKRRHRYGSNTETGSPGLGASINYWPRMNSLSS